jgi:hypothetical protein
VSLNQRPIRMFCMHGHALALSDDLPLLRGAVDQVLAPFATEALPDGISFIEGHLRHYIEGEVLRHLSATAARIPTPEPCIELYHEGDRFWLLDERWGICEVNFFRGQFKSFVLAQASLDPASLVEAAVIWPMAQLLRQRGLHLVRSVSVVKDGFGALVLPTCPIWGEVAALVEAGYELVSQRWTALRVDDGRVEMLHIPGLAQVNEGGEWVDLVQHHQLHAFCNAVILVERGKQLDGELIELNPAQASEALRRDWPVLEVYPTRRTGAMTGALSSLCRCAHARLSRSGGDLLSVIEGMRGTSSAAPMAVGA